MSNVENDTDRVFLILQIVRKLFQKFIQIKGFLVRIGFFENISAQLVIELSTDQTDSLFNREIGISLSSLVFRIWFIRIRFVRNRFVRTWFVRKCWLIGLHHKFSPVVRSKKSSIDSIRKKTEKINRGNKIFR